MATYSNNTTIKIHTVAVNNATLSPATLYTAPADGYAIVQLHINTGSVVWKVSGHVLPQPYDKSIYVGPLQTIAADTFVGSPTAAVSGVEFRNSP